MGIPDHLTSWEICAQVKKQQLELDMEQWTGSKLGREYVKAAYCHLTYSTYMQSTSCEMPGWMKHKLEPRLLGEISITQICRWHQPYSRKQRGPKEPLDESERREWKSWLKTQFSSVQLLSCVRLFVTPWTAARQASLSITNSRGLPKLMSVESVMPSSHLILWRPLLLLPSIFPSIGVFF